MALLTTFTLVGTFLPLFCLGGNKNVCEDPNRKCYHVAALIPARAGSKGIKDKNLSRIGNETLLARSLRAINECGNFDSVWVLTDGKAIADEAATHNAEVHWRNPESATDNASTVSAVEDFLIKHKEFNLVAVVQCTSPFIQKDFLCKALDLWRKSDADCLFSVTRSHHLRWTENNGYCNFCINYEGEVKISRPNNEKYDFQLKSFVSPLNFDPKKRPRRQDWQGELLENGMFYFTKKDLVLQDKVLQNNRCIVFEIPKKFSIEIDTTFDLTLARALEKIFTKNLGD